MITEALRAITLQQALLEAEFISLLSYVQCTCTYYSLPAVPGQPSVNVNSTTSTTISLSWSVPSAGSVVDSYEVAWQRDTSGDCPDEDEGSMSITDGSTSYMITGLEEDSSYNIIVTATNAAGSSEVSDTAVTGEAGYYFCFSPQYLYLLVSIFQLRLLLPVM